MDLGVPELFSMLLLLMLGGAVVVATVAAIFWGRRPQGRSRAVEILEERYARGEIDREELEQRRRDLTGRRGGRPA